VPLYRFTLSKFVFQSSPDEARALLERVVAEQPDNAQALNNLGALLVRAGDLAQARALFVRARDLDGAFVMARANLSRVRARERSLAAHLVRGLVIAVFLTIPVAVACAFLLATEHPVAAGAVGGLGGAAELLVLAGYGFAAHQRRTDAPEWVP
jgi:tetratricopeptide (TPR) repeat protein